METEVAAMLGIHPKTLAKERRRGQARIPFVRVGERGVRYRRTDVARYIKALCVKRGATA
ncbi:helix-turn-helix domain-containing protein [Paraburkholderia sp. UCT31]|uniref:helix-turn-helix domain-containing protein n=1 Tax=Paraburkholderia sp. UCT31 TaxID=2615209 RepID=UPI003976F9BF